MKGNILYQCHGFAILNLFHTISISYQSMRMSVGQSVMSVTMSDEKYYKYSIKSPKKHTA